MQFGMPCDEYFGWGMFGRKPGYLIGLPSGVVVAASGRIHKVSRRDAKNRKYYFLVLVEREGEVDFLQWLNGSSFELPGLDTLRLLAWGRGAKPPRSVDAFLRTRFMCDWVDHSRRIKRREEFSVPTDHYLPVWSKPKADNELDAHFDAREKEALERIRANAGQKDAIAWKSRSDSRWRGIILPSAQRPDIENSRVRARIIGGHSEEYYLDTYEDLVLLKSYLVYWDRLIAPTPDETKMALMSFRLSPSRQKLCKWGVLDSVQIDPTGVDLDGEQLRAFQEKEKEYPGRWVVAIDSMSEAKIKENSGRSLIAKLHSALPVPSMRTSFEDILAFHEKRRSECLALRERIDEMYQRILSAGDGPLQLEQVLGSIGAATADQATVMEEAGLRFQFAGLEARMKWEVDLAKISGSSLAASIASGSLVVGVAAGAASNLVPKVEISTAAGALQNSAKGPWGYALRVQREL